jgi:hypothetical protein
VARNLFADGKLSAEKQRVIRELKYAPVDDRLMTMLLTDYSMCDQDNDLTVRSNEHEFVERTNATPLLDFCLDDLTHKERDALESEPRHYGEFWTLKENGSGVESPKPLYLN